MLDRLKTKTPVWCVAVAFVLTTVAARWVSYVDPGFHYNISGIHIHHYVYGIFMITAAGCCALVFKGPRATFWIALLYGWGAGFTFDEMGIWLNASTNQSLRWEYKGLGIGCFLLIVLGLLSVSKRQDPKPARMEPETFEVSLERQKKRLNKRAIEVLAAEQED